LKGGDSGKEKGGVKGVSVNPRVKEKKNDGFGSINREKKKGKNKKWDKWELFSKVRVLLGKVTSSTCEREREFTKKKRGGGEEKSSKEWGIDARSP